MAQQVAPPHMPDLVGEHSGNFLVIARQPNQVVGHHHDSRGKRHRIRADRVPERNSSR